MYSSMIFLAAWKRPDITEICFKGIQRMGLGALCVGSEGWVKDMCEKYNIHYVYHDNKPLGAKKNFGLKECLKYKWDNLIEIGSDDLLHKNYMDRMKPYFGEFFGPNYIAFVNSETLECRGLKTGTPFGAGRVIPRTMVELSSTVKVKCTESFAADVAMTEGQEGDVPVHTVMRYLSYLEILGDEDLRFWQEDINYGMDNNSIARARKGGFRYQYLDCDKPMVCDIKGPDNLGKWRDNIGDEVMKFDELVKEFPELCYLREN